jgi:hypothetical protein
MPDFLWSLGRWLEHISWTTYIDNSRLLSPAMYVAHFFSFFVLVGTSAIVDLSVLGVAARRARPSELAAQLFPWTWAALAVAVATGFIMFAADATAFLPVKFFWIKLLATLLASASALLVHRNLRKWDRLPAIPARAKLVALLSLLLWIGVILAAVEIPNN